MTPAEAILWRHLRDRRFDGFKFRRQQPVDQYVVDFFCPAARLVVELDGESHIGKEPHDASRQAYLESQGLLVLRFWNHAVYDDKDAVLDAIWMACSERSGRGGPYPSPPTPLPQGERGERQ
jgi:very-short-patch-repair endonuclease